MPRRPAGTSVGVPVTDSTHRRRSEGIARCPGGRGSPGQPFPDSICQRHRRLRRRPQPTCGRTFCALRLAQRVSGLPSPVSVSVSVSVSGLQAPDSRLRAWGSRLRAWGSRLGELPWQRRRRQPGPASVARGAARSDRRQRGARRQPRRRRVPRAAQRAHQAHGRLVLRRLDLQRLAAQYQATVGLVRALGGAWDTPTAGLAPGAALPPVASRGAAGN